MIVSDPQPAERGDPPPISIRRRAVALAILFLLYQSAEGIGDRVLHSFAAQALLMVAALIAAWPVGRWLLGGGGYRAYGLGWRRDVPKWLVGGVALAFVAKALALAVGLRIGVYAGARLLAPPGWEAASLAVLGAAAATFVPSIAEDILTRGFWWCAVPRLRGGGFILVTAILYTLNHLFVPLAGWPRLLCFGIAYAAALVRARTLWAAVGVHWGWNLANALLDRFFDVAGDPALTPWVSAVSHLAIAAVILLLPRRPPAPAAQA